VAVAESVVKPGLADFEAVAVNIEHFAPGILFEVKSHHVVMIAAENSEIPGLLAFANAAAVSSAQNYLAAAVALNFVGWSEQQTHSYAGSNVDW